MAPEPAERPCAPASASPSSGIGRTVLALLPTPLSVAEIAAHLQIPEAATKEHIRSIYRALRVSSRRTAVWEARDRGLLP